MEALFEGLNEEQKEAVTHQEGPLLIIAGAGTGKTTVITRRIAHLIQSEQARSNEIVALTFTDKAAGEMQERVETLLPMGYVDLWISTFHSFCERILREHALDVGLSSDARLLSETEQWLLLREHIDELDLEYYRPKGNPTKFLQSLISHFSRLKDEDITPEEYLEYAESLQANTDTDIPGASKKRKAAPTQQKLAALPQTPEEKEALAQEAQRVLEVAKAYHTYQQLLRENNALDFGDLIIEVIHLFKQRPHILEKYRKQFRYVIVDEFQDTNFAQYDLLKLLAAPTNNITVVADDDQSIYSFRGASMSNILIFRNDFPDAHQVSLVQNYRSRQGILDLAHNFIQNNNPNRLEATLKIDKKLQSNTPGEAIIEHLHSESLEGEAHLVMQKILELKKKQPELLWSDIAILVRANDHSGVFLPYLERAQIPYQFLAYQGLFQKPIILDCIATLRLLDNYNESRALYRFLNIPVWDIDHRDIMALLSYASKKTVSLYQAVKDAALIDDIEEDTVKKLQSLLQLLDECALMARSQTVGEVLLKFLDRSGYLKKITSVESEDAEEQTQYLNQFYRVITSFESATAEKSVRNFILELQMMIDAGDSGKLQPDLDAGPDAVKILTVHASKGLEFEYVFVVNLVDKRFPSIARREAIAIPDAIVKDIIPEGDHHTEEERRLFYVAVTRAKTGLFLTSAENYGGARKKKPSRFLIECGFAETTPQPTGDVLFGRGRELAETTLAKHSATSAELQKYLPHTFSFSQLEAYETCPWQYRFAFLLRVPVPGSSAASFGRSIHQTLYEFFRRGIEKAQNPQGDLFSAPVSPPETAATTATAAGTADDEAISGAPALQMPSKEELLQIYDTVWIDEWYQSQRQKDEYYAKGKEALKAFYDLHHEAWPAVSKLEQVFTMPLGEYKIKGAIDRIDETVERINETGELRSTVRVMDYKTGKYNAKKDTKQLYMYAMALQEVFQQQPSTLSYYFVEENKSVDTPFDPEKMEKTREWVLSLISKITEGDFTPTPGLHCKFCDYRDICEYRQK